MSKLQKLSKQALKNKNLLANFGYLSALQGLNLILPLVTYPYLIRVLGTEVFGSVLFAQAIAAYAAVVVNFGFNITATRDVAVLRNKPNKLHQLVSGVLSIKGLLLLLAFVLLLVLCYTVPAFAEDRALYLLSFGVCFNEWLFPIWFFQGIEKMKYITFIQLASRVTFVLLIFLFVNQESDYLRVPAFYGLGALLAGIISLYVLLRVQKVKLNWQSWSYLKELLANSLPVFYSRVSSVVTERANVLVIGAFLGMSAVTYYDFALKILHAFKIPADILAQTVFPRIAQTQNKLLAKRQLLLGSAWAILAAILLSVFAKEIATLVGGPEMEPMAYLLYFVAALLFITCLSYGLGQPYLVAFGFVKLFSRLVMAANALYIIGLVLLLAFDAVSIVNCLLLLLLSDGVNTLLRFVYSFKKGLFT